MRKQRTYRTHREEHPHTVPRVVVDMCDIFLFGESEPEPSRQTNYRAHYRAHYGAKPGVFGRGTGRRPRRGPKIRRADR